MSEQRYWERGFTTVLVLEVKSLEDCSVSRTFGHAMQYPLQRFQQKISAVIISRKG